MRRAFATVFFFTLTFGTAHAQTATDARAAELKKEADELVHALHYREALERYEQAWALKQDPAILYNRGRALDAIGETPLALDAFEEFVRVAPADLKEKVPNLDELLADVRSRVATLVIRCPVEGASVIVRRKLEGKTPLAAIRLATGDAHIELVAPGYKAFSVDKVLGTGSSTLDVELVREETPVTQTAKPDVPLANPTPAPKSTDANSWKWAAATAGGVGVVGIGLGSVFGVLTIAKGNDAGPHCPARACDAVGSQIVSDGRTFGAVSTIAFIAGGIGLATGAVLFLWKPGGRETAFEPFIGPTWGGVRGTW